MIALLSVATAIQAETVSFSVNAGYDAMVSNDDNGGPDQSHGGTGMHVRDIPARRRVALASFDISAAQREGASFADVTLSVIAANGGTINVYGIVEEQDNISGSLTWNTAPGVQNSPAAEPGEPVALDFDDLSDLLMTISDIPGGSSTRVTSEPSPALADFLSADTDGTVTLLFAPPEGGQVILRSALRWNNPLAGIFLEGLSVLGPKSDWIATGDGNYHDAVNWSDGVPNATDATADLSKVDISTDALVVIDANATLGSLLLGDADLESAGTWALSDVDNTGAVLTLDAATQPTIITGALTPTAGFDDSFLGVLLAGTNGFRKLGPGILTLKELAHPITGTVDIEEGTLRVAAGGQLRGATINLHDGVTYETGDNWANNPFITIEAGASANLIANRTANTTVRRLSGSGEGTSLNITTFSTGRFELQTPTLGIDNWTVNNADPNSTIWFSPVYNNGVTNSLSTNWVKGGALVLNGVNMAPRKSGSGGNNVPIGSLAGDALSGISGANNGAGTVRYEIGSLNTDTEFAGVIQFANGSSGMLIDKVGAGTLTLSGSQNDTMVKDHADIGLNGGVIRISEGTLALTNTFDHFVGGTATTLATIDVNDGAVLDVSGTSNTYYSTHMQQLQGSGTVVGTYDHAPALDPNFSDSPGIILPGNVSAPGTQTPMTSKFIPTAGTLTFDGDLLLNGGSIGFDVSADPQASDLIHVTGTTELNAGSIFLNFLGAAPQGSYTIIRSDGGFTGSVDNISIVLPGRGTAPTPVIDGTDLMFTVPADAVTADLSWVGNTGIWDVQSTADWDNGGTADVFYNSDNVTFDAGGNPNVDVAEALSPGTLFIESPDDYSFTGSGSIQGPSSLVKNGTGNLIMHLENGFTGDATINHEFGLVDMGNFMGALGSGNLQINGDVLITSDGWGSGDKGALNNSGITIPAGGRLIMEVRSGRNRSGAFVLKNISGAGDLELSVTHQQKYYRPSFNGFTGSLKVYPWESATVTGLRLDENAMILPNSVVTLEGTIVQMGGSVNDALIEFGELHADAGTVLAAAETGNPGPPGWNTTYRIGALGTDSDLAGYIQDDGYDGPGCCTDALSHLTKVGAGTLTLSNAGRNTYTGNTTVEAGMLSIDAAYLADTANVILTGDATLNLDFAGTDTINALIIAGDAQVPGTWGAVGSGAENEIALITGSGLLEVTATE